MNEHQPEQLLTPTQVADWLGVTLPAFRAWRHKGQAPPAIKLGKHLRFRPQDVEAWIEAHRD